MYSKLWAQLHKLMWHPKQDSQMGPSWALVWPNYAQLGPIWNAVRDMRI